MSQDTSNTPTTTSTMEQMLTNISECFLGQDMQDLIEMLEMDEISTVQGAVEWARNYEDLLLENATNYREGEENDEQLTTLDAFRTARAALKGQSYSPWIGENRNDLYRYGLPQIGHSHEAFALPSTFELAATGTWALNPNTGGFGPECLLARHMSECPVHAPNACHDWDSWPLTYVIAYAGRAPQGWEAV